MKPRFIRLAYAALGAGILISAVGVYGVVSGMREAAYRAQSEFRDNIVWFAAQFNGELAALTDALHDHVTGVQPDSQATVERFDVFWSRLDSAREGALGRSFLRLPGAAETVADAAATLREFESTVLALPNATSDEVGRFVGALRALKPRLNELTLAALASRNVDVAAEHRAQREGATRLTVLLLGMLVLGTSLVALLLLERAKVAALGRTLAMRVAERTADLAESEDRYRTLVTHAPEAIVVLDAEQGKFIEANENAARLFGVSRERVLECGPGDFSPPLQPDGRASAELVAERVAAALAGEVPIFEWLHQNVSGERIPCEIRLVRLPAAGRSLVRGSITDISVRKRHELELARHRERLEELVEERTRELETAQRDLLRAERLAAIGQLTGTVSHELRNPLATIHTSSVVLAKRLGDQDPSVVRIAERITRNVERCVGIIQDLLDYTRVRDLELRRVDFDAWLRATVADIEVPDAVTVNCDPRSGARVLIDPERLRQVMVNLIDNAALSMIEAPGAEGPLRIDITAATDGERLRLRVADSGPGIAEERRESVFEPLYSTRAFGVGLGLPLVRQIVEQHGGRVELEPAAGHGAAFVVWLALAPAEVAPQTASRSGGTTPA